MGVCVEAVEDGSIAHKNGILPGHKLLRADGQDIDDVLDYRFYLTENRVLLDMEDALGSPYTLKISKNPYQDIGLIFSSYLIDDQKVCKNKCIFCFIDQMPPSQRKTLYVKDDDSRMSFFFGNYITLTNLRDKDIERIIKMRLSPVNISIHTTNPDLRVKMMGNPHAGEALIYLKKLTDSGISLNCQLVLCPGINDGEELARSMRDLSFLRGGCLQSVAAVPVGLTKFRQGLYPLEVFGQADAAKVVQQVEAWQVKLRSLTSDELSEDSDFVADDAFVYLSDEWYVMAGLPLPTYESYGEFHQIDNGVGMLRVFEDEFLSELADASADFVFDSNVQIPQNKSCNIGIITGTSAGAFMRELATKFEARFPMTKINIYVIKNHFFGETVTVSGLLTGQDIIHQMQGKCENLSILYIPQNAFRAGHDIDIMLDDVTREAVALALGVEVCAGSMNGDEFCRQLIDWFARYGFSK